MMNKFSRNALTVVFLFSGMMQNAAVWGQSLQAVIPNPRTLTIDDLGWKRGADESATDGPFRLGTNRDPVLQDYEVLTYVARAVGTRLSAKFVLSEFDRENVLADYPSTNEQGPDWDNSALVGPDDFLYMNYVKGNSAWIELGFHGVRHEYWDWVIRRGKMWRWEFFDRQTKQPWPYDDLVGHLQCFQRILNQYGITSFPKSYTPPGNGYDYAPQSGQDSGTLFSSFGVKYAMCNIEATRDFGTPEEIIQAGGVIHNGLLWIDEAGSDDPNWPLWNAIDAAPQSHPADGIPLTHWPNWWAANPDSNLAVGDKFVAWFNQVKQNPAWYVPKNIAQYFSQWLYRKYAVLSDSAETLIIDNTAMPEEAFSNDLVGNLLLKFPLAAGEHLAEATLDGGGEIAGYYEEFGYGHLLLSPLQKQIYHLNYQKGSSPLAKCVINDGTYNVLSFRTVAETASLFLEMYGTQNVRVRLDFEPLSATSLDTGLVINSQIFDPATKELVINISGKDIMGQKGEVVIQGVPFQALALASPNGGEQLYAQSVQPVTWNWRGLIAAVSLEFSIDRGLTWIAITDSTDNDGVYEWLVPTLVSDSCLLRIADASDGDPSDVADAVFSIVLPPPTLTLTAPNGGEVWLADSTQVITWSSTGTLTDVKLEFSSDAGLNWTLITANTENDGAYSWVIPHLVSSECLVRVSDAADGDPSDLSDAAFMIVAPPPTLVLTSPNGGESFQAGSFVTITWSATGILEIVRLEFSSDAGSTWTSIAPATENDGSYGWTIPTVASDHSLIRISDASDGDPSDTSDGDFSIINDTTDVPAPNQPYNYALHPSYPNPFKPRTRIQFDLPTRERVRLAVYDIRGREVVVLISDVLPDGRHTAVWEGKDASGQRVSSGVYFYHLQAGRFEAISKVTILQ